MIMNESYITPCTLQLCLLRFQLRDSTGVVMKVLHLFRTGAPDTPTTPAICSYMSFHCALLCVLCDHDASSGVIGAGELVGDEDQAMETPPKGVVLSSLASVREHSCGFFI